MSFKDIADIINEYTGEDKQVNKPEKSKDSCAFELFRKVNIPLKCYRVRYARRQGGAFG
jgi:hypothetical protein